MSKHHTPFYNFRRRSQVSPSTLRSHERGAAPRHRNRFLSFQAKWPQNHFAKKKHSRSWSNPSLSPRACWKPNESPGRAGTGSERRLRGSSATLASVFSLHKRALATRPAAGILAPLPKLLHAPAAAARSPGSRAPRRRAVRVGVGEGEEEVGRLPNLSLKDESSGSGARKVKGAAGRQRGAARAPPVPSSPSEAGGATTWPRRFDSSASVPQRTAL